MAYNTIDGSAIEVKGIPLFNVKEKNKLVESFLEKGEGKTLFAKVGRDVIADRKTDKYRIIMMNPKPTTQWVWMDPYFLFPLKVIFTDPYTDLVSQATTRHIRFNEELDPSLFTLGVPRGTKILNFDLSQRDAGIPPLFTDLPKPFSYLGGVKDKNGSPWIFSDYSARPAIFYTLHARNPTVQLPMTGFVQTFEVNGETRHSIPIRGYSLVYYKKGDLHIMLMSNTTYDEVLEISMK